MNKLPQTRPLAIMLLLGCVVLLLGAFRVTPTTAGSSHASPAYIQCSSVKWLQEGYGSGTYGAITEHEYLYAKVDALNTSTYCGELETKLVYSVVSGMGCYDLINGLMTTTGLIYALYDGGCRTGSGTNYQYYSPTYSYCYWGLGGITSGTKNITVASAYEMCI